MKLELKNLINNLDKQTKKYLENSAQRCIVRGGSEILIEDILYVFLEDENSIFSLMLNQYRIDKNELIKVIQKEVKISISESNSPIFSTILVNWLEDSYSYAKLILNQNEITQSSMILSLFENSIKYSNTKYFKIFEEIDVEELKSLIEGLNEKPIENKTSNENSNTKSEIEKYTTDLTQLAKENRIDPVLCRDDEIKQAIDILLRRRKNNPILVGEAGVGKTAVVEGLALKIVNNEVPVQLKEAKILSLDVGALQAGASVKGEFERRLQEVINKLKASSEFVILFIDEAHTLIGAGGNEGGSDAANLLKPALARGELKTIAATTWLEYRKYFEKDPALSRRFQKINLLEPTVTEATTILRGIAKKYEEAHDVYIEDDAIKSASSLSARYITGRQLPDKAIDVLDTACANVKISQSNIPFELQKIATKILEKEREIEFLQRDDVNKIKNNKEKIKILKNELKVYEDEEKLIRTNWEKQKEVLEQIGECKDKKEKSKLKTQLKTLQKNNMYIFNTVNKEQVAKVISSWTGIPLGNMVEEQIKTVVELEDKIKDKVIGQEQAISYLNRFLQISISGLKKEDSPTGVFLLVGPSGVGKTETAKAIAQLMYGGERFITTINMTEFQEKHTVSRLIGSPPGYVGYGDGGQLTDPVRVKPYSVILLDEIEKAHPDILNLFYQIFDKGEVNDGEGRVIDFKNTTIIMTSNLATKEITNYCQNNKDNISLEELSSLITPVLSDYLKPALLGRMNVIPYFNLNEEALIKITKQKFEITKKQLLKKEIDLEIDENLIKYIVSLSNSIDTGARNIDLIINTKIMPKLSKYLLDSSINKKKIKNISLNLDSKSNEILIK
ncbi:type VI secretion system, ClpV1 family ATPase TssH [Malaciobacter marinus]|uniref:Chaperone protein ClpB n=1 Tax=Malaciobacter marinus TaxID=505249 RepID=A0A347TKK5_9BACT|nr:type VI secretion system ATPase TssH [Malaciobacter marinus]AXX87133.1 type VI secretion system, ClpV1 family ATPase TssH [Malaciobacter marinus]PHO12279.1 type VI secretion system ATPase TssH [Malaciobacter marinus]PHO16342.1 type VI secretion system ATPase TssH [Malaciobacter marinus]